MSLYYTLVFGILVFEIGLFSLLAMPIPSKFRGPMTLIMLRPFNSPTVQVAIKCLIGFVLLLFLDSINKVYSIDREIRTNQERGGGLLAQDRIDALSRKFLAQRNMYLTGITLFLTFVVVRTFHLVTELLHLKEKVRGPAGKPKGKGHEVHISDEDSPAMLESRIKDADEEIRRLKTKAEKFQEEM